MNSIMVHKTHHGEEDKRDRKEISPHPYSNKKGRWTNGKKLNKRFHGFVFTEPERKIIEDVRI